MTPDEREKISVQMCLMWPRKFDESTLTDWFMRIGGYRADDVLRALNEHKNSSKFCPQVSEILAKLKGKEERNENETTVKVDDFATAMRKNNSAWKNCNDQEVILRYWRSIWTRYDYAAAARLQQIPKQGSEKAVAWHVAQVDGYRTRCRVSCVNCLASTGMVADLADRTAEFIFAAPDDFRLALAEVRGEVEDPFATTEAA